MKSVLLSIRPKWCELIAKGEKTIEIRKTRPKLEPPFKVYIYCTEPKKWFRYSAIGRASDECLWLANGKVEMCDGFKYWADGGDYTNLNGKVIGEFVCRKIRCHHVSNLIVKEDAEATLRGTCLTKKEVCDYIGYKFGDFIYKKPNLFYGWEISDLVIYDQPKSLRKFHAPCDSKCDGMCYEGVECCRVITRAPKSWCYVEEVKA